MIGEHRADRGVSIAITHVLTIAITTVLISGLLISAGALLEGERDRSADRSLETIGERLAGELSKVDSMATDDSANASMTVRHPARAASERYTVTLREDCGPDAPLLEDGTSCLHLSTQSGSVDVYVPVTVDVNGESEVNGGAIKIVHEDGEITLERGS